MSENVVVPRKEWEVFARGEVLAFMIENGLKKISIEDGKGKKIAINKNSQGAYKVLVTTGETL
jgi:hypothetical protein